MALEESDRRQYLRRTPLGRKVWFRKRALEMLGRGPTPEAQLLLAWSRLPAREWASGPPDRGAAPGQGDPGRE